jgi:cell division protein FtsB
MSSGASKLIFRLIRNKYFLSVTAFSLWLLFFDKNDVFSQYELIARCHKLEQEKTYYIREISAAKTAFHELRTNPKSLERIAREKYLMKKDNEEVYVFVTH